MKRWTALLISMMLLVGFGCAYNKKSVEISDSKVYVHGDVDPQFLRENTTESQEQKTDADTSIPVPGLCDGCHAAYAMGSLPSDWQEQAKEWLEDQKKPDEPKPSPPPTPKPVPPPVPKPEPAPQPSPKPAPKAKVFEYAHANPISYAEGAYKATGRGVSIITCPGEAKYDSITWAGENLHFHDMDRGRQIWTNVYFNKGKQKTRISGKVVAKRGRDTWETTITGEGTYDDHRGKCFRQYR